MKKIFILTIILLAGISSYGQRKADAHEQTISSFIPGSDLLNNIHIARTTAVGDTFALKNITNLSDLTIYKLGANDSGYLTGMNYWNDHAFAEKYNFNSNDSSMVVIGVMTEFAGTVNPASTQTINFNVWAISDTQFISSGLAITGFPNGIADSFTVGITRLGVGPVTDTLKTFIFSTPTTALSGPFFIGYSINYDFGSLTGDTIGVTCSPRGVKIPSDTSYYYNVDVAGDTTLDTFIYVQNATLEADGNWYDNYTQNDSLFNNLAIFPVVVIGNPTGIKGITRNNLTFFGNFPNPASDYTNIKFSLATPTGISIQIFDMASHLIQTISEPGLISGEHIVGVNTSEMPAGDYIYLVKTSAGDGIAGKLTVSRN